MKYVEILRIVKSYAHGQLPTNYYQQLTAVASALKRDYNIEPVDIVAAIKLLDSGNINYAMHLMRRAYKDLVRIGKEKGYI